MYLGDLVRLSGKVHLKGYHAKNNLWKAEQLLTTEKTVTASATEQQQ